MWNEIDEEMMTRLKCAICEHEACETTIFCCKIFFMSCSSEELMLKEEKNIVH